MIRTRGHRRFAPLTVYAIPFLLVAAAAIGNAAASQDCIACHEQIGKQFETTIHGRIQGFEVQGLTTGCVSCHGDGMEHMESGGDAAIRSFDPAMPVEEATAVCGNCHQSHAVNDWMGSEHPLNGVGCTDCHQTHVKHGEERRSSEVCADCHVDVKAQLQYPSHHPVREGHMDCISCHQPHGTTVGLLKTDERPSELCLDCHTHLQGPFVFEHEPVFEGCETCHTPHGSVANNLLVQNEPFLCLQCHEMHFHAGLEAEEEESVRIPRYDSDTNGGAADGIEWPGGEIANPWGQSGYKRAFTTKCTQCHTMVHGSDLPSQATPGLGDGLMR